MAETSRSVEKPTQGSAAGCLTRLCWMLVGNVALLVSIKFMADHRGSFLSAADYVFWGIVAALIGLRYVDIAKLRGCTATGQPATMAHWKRYTLFLIIFAGVVWGLAHFWAAHH